MKGWFWIIGAVMLTVPGLFIQLAGLHLDKENPPVAALILGLSVVGAAFLLSWACEVAEKDIPPALALSVLALIAVLPEYAVDFSLTWQAAQNPAYQEYAVANMIGANRMIVGFAWPLIVLLFWLRFRKTQVTLNKSQRVEVGFLMVAGLYSIIIPIKGHIDFIDVVVLVGLFILYTWRITKSEVHEPELVGPAEVLGQLPTNIRRVTILGLTIFAAGVIFVAAHPFAESLILTGTKLGIDEVFMVQWFAPLASEAPEIVVCVLFTLRGLANAGMGALVASKVNQWTLLVGTLPLVFSFSSGRIRALPLTEAQVGAMFVTSGQTLLAVVILINLHAHLAEAGLLFFLLISQFFVPEHLNLNGYQFDTHFLFGTIYMLLTVALAIRHRHDFIPTFRAMFNLKDKTLEDGQDEEGLHQLEGSKGNIINPVVDKTSDTKNPATSRR